MGNIGNPKFKVGDVVTFKISCCNKVSECVGRVEIVDAYGTFEQDTEPSYDIMVDDFAGTGKCLCKHLRESSLRGVANEGDNSPEINTGTTEDIGRAVAPSERKDKRAIS